MNGVLTWFSSGSLDSWEKAIDSSFSKNNFEKTSVNYAIVLTLLEQESSFNENPILQPSLDTMCDNILNDDETRKLSTWGQRNA